jgi:hypothetical protein
VDGEARARVAVFQRIIHADRFADWCAVVVEALDPDAAGFRVVGVVIEIRVARERDDEAAAKMRGEGDDAGIGLLAGKQRVRGVGVPMGVPSAA